MGGGTDRTHTRRVLWHMGPRLRPLTFKVRIGGSGVGTLTFNGGAGARVYGGVLSSSITIWETAA